MRRHERASASLVRNREGAPATALRVDGTRLVAYPGQVIHPVTGRRLRRPRSPPGCTSPACVPPAEPATRPRGAPTSDRGRSPAEPPGRGPPLDPPRHVCAQRQQRPAHVPGQGDGGAVLPTTIAKWRLTTADSTGSLPLAKGVEGERPAGPVAESRPHRCEVGTASARATHPGAAGDRPEGPEPRRVSRRYRGWSGPGRARSMRVVPRELGPRPFPGRGAFDFPRTDCAARRRFGALKER